MAAYAELISWAREVHLLDSTAAVLAWDRETHLPPGGVEHRARQLASLATLAHGVATRAGVGDLLDAAAEDPATADPDSLGAANLRELRRDHARRVRVPAALVSELAETTSLAQHHWAIARSNSDFGRFAPWLERVVDLQRRRAECLRTNPSGKLWDALADGFEPGLLAVDVERLFAGLRPRLTALVGELQASGRSPDAAVSRVQLPIEAQEAFVRFVAEQIGFDFKRGRLDRSTHPFCSGFHSGDVRLTTRFHEADFLDALGSTMHEAGHGIYEQGLDPEQTGTPGGETVSLGLHESQSRLWENHVGRSRAFWEWCQPHLRRFFGNALDDYDADTLFGAANVVAPSLIRVEADEATYDLHVMLRFELELALLQGDLEVEGLPTAWNDRYRTYLGIEVPDDARGCLQDVHWSCGLFGYFPTYTLGNLYAAQWIEAARAELGDIDSLLRRGEFAPLRAWLNQQIHQHGRRYTPAELGQRITGSKLSPDTFLAYLEDKTRGLHGVQD